VLAQCCFFICRILPSKPALTATHIMVGGSILRVDQTNERESGVRATDSQHYNGPELLSCGHNTNNCCLQNQRCGSNLLCYNPSRNTLSRQYCADPDWKGCSALEDGKPSTLNIFDNPLTSTKDLTGAGTQLTYCGNNTVTGVGESCQTGVVWFVDPADGTLYNTSEKSSTAQPTWWSIDSSAILASATASGFSITPSSLSATVTPTGSAAVSAASTTATAPSANTPSASPSSSGLSTGAGAGIGIGAAAAIAAAAVAVWLYIRRRRRQSASRDQGQKPFEVDTREAPYPYSDAQKTVYAHETVAQPPRQELGGQTRSELP
jgi:hypothetical protein